MELNNKINFFFKEFEKLKDEQNKRIEFRDHMIYITLGVIGGVFSFILEKPEYITALLVLPFVNIILGWTYLMNDKKISEIGDYIREVLIPKIELSLRDDNLNIYPSWEEYHKMLPDRRKTKIFQLVLDLLLFSLTSALSVVLFFFNVSEINKLQLFVIIFESLIVVFLAIQFINASVNTHTN